MNFKNTAVYPTNTVYPTETNRGYYPKTIPDFAQSRTLHLGDHDQSRSSMGNIHTNDNRLLCVKSADIKNIIDDIQKDFFTKYKNYLVEIDSHRV